MTFAFDVPSVKTDDVIIPVFQREDDAVFQFVVVGSVVVTGFQLRAINVPAFHVASCFAATEKALFQLGKNGVQAFGLKDGVCSRLMCCRADKAFRFFYGFMFADIFPVLNELYSIDCLAVLRTVAAETKYSVRVGINLHARGLIGMKRTAQHLVAVWLQTVMRQNR